MQRTTLLALVATSIFCASPAFGRDDVLKFPIADVLNNPTYAARLTGVSFFFGEQAHPQVASTLGSYMSNKKTNGVGKSDKEACEWAFLSALLSLHDRALQEGGNAVINVTGYYKKIPFSSETEFQCGAGATMAGVTLKGTVVKLK